MYSLHCPWREAEYTFLDMFLFSEAFYSWWWCLIYFLHFSLIQVNEEGVMIPPQTCLIKTGCLINPWTGSKRVHLWRGLDSCGYKQPKRLAAYVGQPTSGLGGLQSPPEQACHRQTSSWERSLDHSNCQTVSGDGLRRVWLEVVNLWQRGCSGVTGGEEHVGVLGSALRHRLSMWPKWMMYPDALFHVETISYVARALKQESEKLISNTASKADLLLVPHQGSCHHASVWEHGENYIS